MHEEQPKPDVPMKTVAIWCTVCMLVVFVLSLVFAHVPEPMRRLGLRYALFGLFCGGGLAWLGRELGLSASRRLLIFGIACVALGGGHLGWVSFQQFRAERRAEIQRSPKQLAMLNMLENLSPDDETAEEYRQLKRDWDPQFESYLRYRLSGTGKWTGISALGFWVGEIILAAVLAGIMLSRGLPDAIQNMAATNNTTTSVSEAVDNRHNESNHMTGEQTANGDEAVL